MDAKNPSISVGDVNQAKGIAIGDGAHLEIHEAPPAPKPGSAPPLPSLVIGREDDLRNLKLRLGLTGETSLQVLTAIRGWPGIGKTTIAAVLAQHHLGRLRTVARRHPRTGAIRRLAAGGVC